MAKRWYVIHTYSGYENRVKTDLNQRIETYGMEDRIVDIQIPTEQVFKEMAFSYVSLPVALSIRLTAIYSLQCSFFTDTEIFSSFFNRQRVAFPD